MASPRRARLLFLLCLAGAFLLGTAGKLWLIKNEGFEVPYMDEWHAVGLALLIPAEQGNLKASSFTWPHNEHRVVWTRALALGLVRANGLWDARLGMIVNTFIHVSAVVLALALLTSRTEATTRWFGALAAAACLAIPFAWENTLAEFQSSFYFWLLLTIPAAWLMLSRAPLGGRWWAGLFLGALAFGSLASGFFVFVAVAIVLGFDAVFDGRRGFREFTAIAICLAMSAIGWSLVHHVPGHDALRSRDLLEFIHACANQLAFPALEHPWLAPLMQAPVAIWLWNRGKFGPLEESRRPINGLILVALLSIVSIAWGRGAVLQGRDPRYGDIQALLFLINGVLLIRITLGNTLRPSVRGAIASAWCVAALVGFSGLVNFAMGTYLPALHKARVAESGHIATFLRYGDPAEIVDAPPREITFPPRAQLAQLLTNPAIASVMPASVRPPVPVSPDEEHTSGFSEGAPGDLPKEGRAWSASSGDGAHFVSLPLPPSRSGLLRFKIAGDLGTAAFPFHLRSLKTGVVSAPVVSVAAGERWKTVNIVRPDDPIVVEAGPSKDAAWGAFTEPVELGTLSWLAGKCAKNWWLFAFAGTACMLGAVLLGIIPAKRRDVFSLKEDGTVVLSSPDL